MSVIRKLILKRGYLNVQKIIVSLRSYQLSTVDLKDPFVIRSVHEDVVIPEISIPEVVQPKFEAYAKYTAVVSEKMELYSPIYKY